MSKSLVYFTSSSVMIQKISELSHAWPPRNVSCSTVQAVVIARTRALVLLSRGGRVVSDTLERIWTAPVRAMYKNFYVKKVSASLVGVGSRDNGH